MWMRYLMLCIGFIAGILISNSQWTPSNDTHDASLIFGFVVIALGIVAIIHQDE